MLKLFYCPPVEPGVYFHALKDTNKQKGLREQSLITNYALRIANYLITLTLITPFTASKAETEASSSASTIA